MRKLYVLNISPDLFCGELTEKAIDIIDEFNNSHEALVLNLYEDKYNVNRPVSELLEEALYDYSVTEETEIATQLLDMLSELEVYCIYPTFTEEDVRYYE